MSGYNALGLQVPLEHYTAAVSEAFPKVFSPRLVESTIASRQTVDILPVNSGVNNKFTDTYLEFIIKGVHGQLVDLSSIALELSIDLTEEDGTTPIPDTKNVAIVNGLSQTLFKSAIVYFNETVVETSSLFSYWSYIKLLSTISGCKVARYDKLTQFFKRDDPSKIEAGYFTNATAVEKQRMTAMKASGINTCFKLMLDATSVSEYILDNVDIRVRLELQPDKWVILSDNAQANLKYNIKAARLWIDRVVPYPAGLIAINKAMVQNNSPITYTFNKTLYKTYILGTGQQSLTLDQPWGTVIPERLYLVILDMEAVSGGYNRNPLYLENCGLRRVLISQNSTNIVNIACDFPHNCAKLYYTALQALGFDNDNVLTYNAYVNGGTILAFNLQPEDIDDSVPLEKSGNLRIALEFKQGVDRNKVILVYGSTTGVININAERRVICDTRG